MTTSIKAKVPDRPHPSAHINIVGFLEWRALKIQSAIGKSVIYPFITVLELGKASESLYNCASPNAKAGGVNV